MNGVAANKQLFLVDTQQPLLGGLAIAGQAPFVKSDRLTQICYSACTSLLLVKSRLLTGNL